MKYIFYVHKKFIVANCIGDEGEYSLKFLGMGCLDTYLEAIK